MTNGWISRWLGRYWREPTPTSGPYSTELPPPQSGKHSSGATIVQLLPLLLLQLLLQLFFLLLLMLHLLLQLLFLLLLQLLFLLLLLLLFLLLLLLHLLLHLLLKLLLHLQLQLPSKLSHTAALGQLLQYNPSTSTAHFAYPIGYSIPCPL